MYTRANPSQLSVVNELQSTRAWVLGNQRGYAVSIKPIIAINGGLGNQLFQWCFANSIQQPGNGFYLDLLFNDSTDSSAILQFQIANLVFPQQERLASLDSPVLRGFASKFWHLVNYLWLLRPNASIFQALGYYRENPNKDIVTSSFPPLNLRYAYGYFQNYELVSISWPKIKTDILSEVERAKQQIMSRFSLDFDFTVIHLRKYQTIGVEFTTTQFSNLSAEYFLSWREKFPHDRIVVLTENQLDFKELIYKLKPEIVIDSKNSNAWEALSILGGAKRLLASNSSISWWGAWLSHQQGGETWLPESWSFWGNVETSKLHFPGCNTWPSIWDNSGFKHL